MGKGASSLALAGVLVALIAGCNAVLNIDEAEPRPGARQSDSRAVPTAECNVPRGECAMCIPKHCRKSLTQCLSSHGCRKALNEYRACLGEACSNPRCVTSYREDAELVTDCVEVDCGDCIGTSPIVSMCDLYCACMQQQLPTTAGESAVPRTCEDFNGAERLHWALGDASACQVECQKLDLTSISCRWSHCELAASGESARHCQHAISDQNCPLLQPIGECQDRQPGGFGCADSSECCSEVCSNDICAN